MTTYQQQLQSHSAEVMLTEITAEACKVTHVSDFIGQPGKIVTVTKAGAIRWGG